MANTRLWTGRIMSWLVILFLLFDSIIHISHPKIVVDSFIMLGYNPSVAVPLGIISLICVIIYAIPRMSVLGAILLTGYLGGAVATNVRVGGPVFNIVFPVILGILLWGGLYLRDHRVSSLIPVRR